MLQKKIVSVFILCFLIIHVANAQKAFLRIYNSNNQKFQKGYLLKTSDSGLILMRKGTESGEIKYSDVYKIRMKRSAGLTALIVGGIPAAAGTVLMARNSGWDGLAGLILFMQGLFIAPIAGGIKAVLNPRPLIIGGNHENWMIKKQLLDQKLQ
jgi:hypothetical protein